LQVVTKWSRGRGQWAPRTRPTSGPKFADSKPSAPPDTTTSKERGYDFWVLHDPWHNEFCVLQINFPDLLGRTAALARHRVLCQVITDRSVPPDA
jgi:hypothetical protein